jgi:prepilin-type N-terminal cleavage/methylation domain-containing protein
MKESKNKRGFTLIEMIVTIGISSLIIIAVVGVFASFVKNRRGVRLMQQSMENTRSALELMGKSLRMSCNISLSGTNKIYFADQTLSSCISYEFDTNKIVRKEYTEDATGTIDLCNSNYCKFANPYIPGTNVDLTDTNISGISFSVMNNNVTNKEIPRITISIQSSTSDKIVQTTVSARDYYYLEPR